LTFNKKGNVIADSVLVVFVLFIFTIITVVGYIISNDINADLQQDEDISASAKAELDDLNNRFPSVFDSIFAMAFILFWIVVLIASFLIDSHPIFFILTMILFIGILIGGAMFSNAYEEFEADPEYSSYAQNFPIMSFVNTHLVIFLLAIGASIGIVLFGKNRLGG
jgi:hypothetical protein